VIKYIPQKRSPMVIFFEERLDEKSIYISRENFQTRRERYTERSRAMLQYATSTDKCRSQTLLEYFGEPGSEACGECDICRIKKESVLRQEEFNLIREEILAVLNLQPLSPDELLERIAVHRDKVVEVLQWLLDNDELKLNGEMRLAVSKK